MLFVCTGNICRSPLGEQLFRARADEVAQARFGAADAAGTLLVASAGVHARDGDPMTSQAADLSIRYGAKPARHLSGRLTKRHLEQAGLVLGATRDHRREIVSMYPRASRIAFTITEFARLFDNLVSDAPATDRVRSHWGTPDFAPTVVAAVASRRGLVRPEHAADDDVTDPYRRSQNTYDAVGTVLDDAMTSMKRSFEALLP